MPHQLHQRLRIAVTNPHTPERRAAEQNRLVGDWSAIAVETHRNALIAGDGLRKIRKDDRNSVADFPVCFFIARVNDDGLEKPLDCAISPTARSLSPNKERTFARRWRLIAAYGVSSN